MVFLTGQEEIQIMQELLTARSKLLKSNLEMIICVLYAALPQEQQLLVFNATQPGKRKVILATNIAESSITINGIRYVIDVGLVKVNYSPLKFRLEDSTVLLELIVYW